MKLKPSGGTAALVGRIHMRNPPFNCNELKGYERSSVHKHEQTITPYLWAHSLFIKLPFKCCEFLKTHPGNYYKKTMSGKKEMVQHHTDWNFILS